MAGNNAELKISQALDILKLVGLPEAQQNERSALTLLALCDIRQNTPWKKASSPMLGITPIMAWFKRYYGKEYAPNSRETVRRETIHQFVDAGIAVYNPDQPNRPVNSPKTVYQLAPEAQELVRTYGSPEWDKALVNFLDKQSSLASRYAMERDMAKIPIIVDGDTEIQLSPGAHSELIRKIIDEFAPRFSPGSKLAYVGDTEDKWAYHDQKLLDRFGIAANTHGKMPDVVLYDETRNWIFLVESVTSHGPVDGKRMTEMKTLFAASGSALVYVTAFPTRKDMCKYLPVLAWETEVWLADSPTHMIHLDGEKFLGPY